MSNELKPCPFCGGEAWQFIPSDVRMINKGCFVECKRCGVRTSCGYPNGDTVDVSLLVWNTRALTPKQQCADEMYELLTDLRHTISLAGIIGADNTAVLKSIDNLLAKARGVLNE